MGTHFLTWRYYFQYPQVYQFLHGAVYGAAWGLVSLLCVCNLFPIQTFSKLGMIYCASSAFPLPTLGRILSPLATSLTFLLPL
jgi:hypothetical protein